ncbi:hypothetical protein Tco_0204704 [Tanacetum coccineum]
MLRHPLYFMHMVNTRTDAELAAAVQAAVDAMLPQIREQVREEYRNGASGSGGNPPPVTIHTWLERFNKQKPRTIMIGSEQFREEIMQNRHYASDIRMEFGRYRSNSRVMSESQIRIKTDMDMTCKTVEQESVTSTTMLIQILGLKISKFIFPYFSWIRDSGECRHAARNCFKYGQTGHLQQDAKEGHCGHEPSRNFLLSADVVYDISLLPELKPIAETPYRISPVKWIFTAEDRCDARLLVHRILTAWTISLARSIYTVDHDLHGLPLVLGGTWRWDLGKKG